MKKILCLTGVIIDGDKKVAELYCSNYTLEKGDLKNEEVSKIVPLWREGVYAY